MRSVFLMLVLPIMLSAQPEFFGYFESEADGMQVGNSYYSFGYNKLRLDIEARPNDYVLIGANMNVQQYWGQTTWNMLDFLPETIWRPIFLLDPSSSGSGEFQMPITIADTLLLDNIYLKASFAKFDLTVGRQQVSPGVGYAWNPTDIFNSKTLLDPSYEQTGVNVIRAEFPLATRLTLNTVVQAKETWENSTKQAFLKTGLGSFDFELSFAEYRWGLSQFTATGMQISQSKRSLFGASFVGEIFGWGLWAEGAYNELELSDSFNEVVLGLDHTFDNSVYLLIEFLHNEQGVKNQTDLTFDTFLQSLAGETHSLMQDYAFIYLMHQTFDFVSLSGIAIANLNDESGTVGPQVDWEIYENMSLSFQGSLSWGAKNTEFGLQDWGARLRLTSSF